MSGIKEGFRCGHCGRTFNRSYLHHNNLWCPNCRFFICNECVPYNHYYCPRCKYKNLNRMNDLFSLAIFIGTVMLFISIVAHFRLLFNNDTADLVLSFLFVGLACIFYIIAFFSYLIIKNRYKIHKDYLVRLPSGEIPIEKRPVTSRRTYIPKEDSSIEHKYPTPKDFNLKGIWNEIALSKDEWRERCKEESFMFLIFFILSFIGALVLVIIPLYFSGNIVCGEGIFLIFFCIIFVIAYIDEMRKGIKDTPRYVSINLKTVGMKRVQELVTSFLTERSINYSCKTIKPDRKYNFILPGELVIKIFYKENRSAYALQNQKRLEIHYDNSNYEKAREIQVQMDKFFTQKDIIFQKI